jgi:protein arginine kinase activator
MEMDPSVEKASKPTVGERCPNCGLTYVQFRQTGRLGCSQCYEAFSQRLIPLIKRIQGSTEHTGKIPLRRGHGAQRQRQLETLRVNLNRAVAREEFEEAARLRDQIRELEKGMEQ